MKLFEEVHLDSYWNWLVSRHHELTKLVAHQNWLIGWSLIGWWGHLEGETAIRLRCTCVDQTSSWQRETLPGYFESFNWGGELSCFKLIKRVRWNISFLPEVSDGWLVESRVGWVGRKPSVSNKSWSVIQKMKSPSDDILISPENENYLVPRFLVICRITSPRPLSAKSPQIW